MARHRPAVIIGKMTKRVVKNLVCRAYESRHQRFVTPSPVRRPFINCHIALNMGKKFVFVQESSS
jgi:hypothetical protein